MALFFHFVAFLSIFAAFAEAAAIRFRPATVPQVQRRTVSFSPGPGMPSLESLNITMESLFNHTRPRLGARSESFPPAQEPGTCHHTGSDQEGQNADIEVIEACITYLEYTIEDADCGKEEPICHGFSGDGRETKIQVTGQTDTPPDDLCLKVLETLRDKIVPPCCSGKGKAFCNGRSSIYGEPVQDEEGDWGILSAGLSVEVTGEF